MEVHHHPDLHHKKKNFKEYFLEFLMIFLAVTLGFIAENIREYYVDKAHERQYISSFYEDVSRDEIELPVLINSIQRQQLHAADSLPILFKSANTIAPANSIYYFLRSMIRQQGINSFITDRTISQVKNSGEMRLITNKQISDSLIDYYKQIEFVAYLQASLLEMKKMMAETLRPILNGYDYAKVIDSTDHLIHTNENLYLMSADPIEINNCLLSISEINGLSITIRNVIIQIKNKADNIKELIADKYNIKE
jgi:hypothetical protein